MAIGSIGVGATPGEDGSAIDNQVAGPNQPTTDGREDTEDKEGLWQWCCSLLPAFALL